MGDHRRKQLGDDGSPQRADGSPQRADEPDRYTGTVSFFLGDKGYGFLKRDGEPDLFVHRSAVNIPGRNYLRQGEPVDFGVAHAEGGKLKAVDVRPRRLRVGDTVRLAEDFVPNPNARKPNLSASETGEIVEDAEDEQPFRVKGPDGDFFWYREPQLQLVDPDAPATDGEVLAEARSDNSKIFNQVVARAG
eukprot:gene42441-23659_t